MIQNQIISTWVRNNTINSNFFNYLFVAYLLKLILLYMLSSGFHQDSISCSYFLNTFFL